MSGWFDGEPRSGTVSTTGTAIGHDGRGRWYACDVDGPPTGRTLVPVAGPFATRAGAEAARAALAAGFSQADARDMGGAADGAS